MSAALKARLAKLKAEKAAAKAASNAASSVPIGSASPMRRSVSGFDQDEDPFAGSDSPRNDPLGQSVRSLGGISSLQDRLRASMRGGLGVGDASKVGGFALDNAAADRSPEVHFLGSIVGGQGFDSGVSVRWSIVGGRGWKRLEGQSSGQSQFGYPERRAGGVMECVWAHPIDVHFSARTLQGWPRILVHVWALDEHGCCSLVAYGQCAVPAAPGRHLLECRTWRPTGTSTEEMLNFFIGGAPRLRSDEILFAKAFEDRCRINTVGHGMVSFDVTVLLKHFQGAGIDFGTGV
jgi:B9 domain-containing protein 2